MLSAMSSLAIALIDAANNCERDGASAILTLRSGREIGGKLSRLAGNRTVHVNLSDGGWSTVLVEEIAAVTAIPSGR
jgi:hypothetical protein